MPGLTVRRYREGDAPRVRELNRVAMATTPEYVPDAPDADLRNVSGHYLDTGGEFLVGEVRDAAQLDGVRDGEVVAMGAYQPLDGWMADRVEASGEAAELTRIRVDPAVQGRGFGTRTVEHLVARARRDGYDALVLNTGADNERARGCYESLGFVCVGTERVRFEGARLHLALYRRRLNE